MIRHHPSLDLLADYASGALPEPLALLIACHASLCAECRGQLAALDKLGGAILDELSPAPLGDDALEDALRRIDRSAPAPLPEAAAALDARSRAILPAPLRRYLPQGMGALRWRWRGPLREARFDLPSRGFRVSLFRLKAGAAAPRHGHAGHEFTLVLEGGFRDAGRQYNRGDFALADSSRAHVQIADEEGCLCLVVLDAPVRLSGVLGAIANRFLRF